MEPIKTEGMTNLCRTRPDLLLKIHNLSVSFPIKGDLVPVVDQVSFSISRGEVLAVVGESGCGKSQVALALMGLTSPSGTVILKGSGLDVQKAMVFQEPMTALNPVLRIGYQIQEAIRIKKSAKGEQRKNLKEQTLAFLQDVGIEDPDQRYYQYPHEFSGGMRQRVLIAMALAREPELLIADEPTTALDVTIQAQIINLLRDLNKNRGLAILYITHDMDLVRSFADRILVMYAGRIVEVGPAKIVLEKPQHPYTRALMSLASLKKNADGYFSSIPGTVPQPDNLPAGCRYHPRCDRIESKCKLGKPPLQTSSFHEWYCIHK